MGLMIGEPGVAVTGKYWEILLGYEQEVRRKAVRFLQQGLDLEKAFPDAWNDGTVKNQYFLTPLQLSSFRRPAQDAFDDAPRKKPRNEKGDSKGDGKGKGKGKGKGRLPATCNRVTPDGRQICYGFNIGKNKCKAGSRCKFSHVCGVCYKEGVPMYDCSHGAAK